MDGDSGEQVANLTCETGKETCEGKGVVIKLDAKLASLADGTVGPKGARARPLNTPVAKASTAWTSRTRASACREHTRLLP